MTTIHIPAAALEAGARAAYEADRPDIDGYPWDEIGDWRQALYRRSARAAFEAMVGAWPGMHSGMAGYAGEKPIIGLILPLTENPDDKA